MDTFLSDVLKQPWKAYCISLARCTERRERFAQWAADNSLPFTFWDAVDKKDLTQATVISADQASMGATACRLSHEALWKHCLLDKETQYFFILEDDAGFKSHSLKEFQTFVKGAKKTQWSILQFGFGTMTGSELHLLSRRVPPGIFQVNFCDQTHALLYTRQAIQDMLQLSQTPAYSSRPSDGLLLTYVQKKKGVVLAPESSIIEQTDTMSFISH